MFHLLKNKHLILAMFVAPVLAIIAYFAVDHIVSEVPHEAERGSSYQLVAKSNCRYKSGRCTLQNGDVEVSVTAARYGADMLDVTLVTALPISDVLISLDENAEGLPPVSMIKAGGSPESWTASFDLVDPAHTVLRLALKIEETLYYAETTAIFIDYETAFSRDNFTQR